MPPRKRAQSAPQAESEPAVEHTTTAEETGGHAEDAKLAADAPVESEAPKDEQDGPERSDLQAADLPCAECMPNGWPEGAFAVGCTHGTWVRENS